MVRNVEQHHAAPIHFLYKNPRGWLDASLPKIRQSNGAIREASQNGIVESAQVHVEEQWLKRTGIQRVEDINFSLIVPIHNEEVFLPSVLGTLMMASIPRRANIQVLLVTNGCTDAGRSERIVNDFMQQLGDVQQRQIPQELLGEIPDQEVDSVYKTVATGGIRFNHITTPTPGKANALNVANVFAQSHGPIGINMDANNFIEPDALLEMYAEAYHHMVKNPDTTTLVRSHPSFTFQQKGANILVRKGHGLLLARAIEDLGISDEAMITGQLLAWDTHWLGTVGGFPQTLTEDISLGLVARTTGKE